MAGLTEIESFERKHENKHVKKRIRQRFVLSDIMQGTVGNYFKIEDFKR